MIAFAKIFITPVRSSHAQMIITAKIEITAFELKPESA
jgi:hypothetical protein